MNDESAQTIVALLLRIDARLEALEKKLDGPAPGDEREAAERPAWSGADRRSVRQPISHEERRKLSGEV